MGTDIEVGYEDVTAYTLVLEQTFLGYYVRRGAGLINLTRIFRYGIGRCEERRMDEHITVSEGRIAPLPDGVFYDDNLNGFEWWAQKHFGYAMREAVDMLAIEYHFSSDGEWHINTEAAIRRRKKERYVHLPLIWRAIAYFCIRYFLKGGFLEGKPGFVWHFFQGLWYRCLVDFKIMEIKRLAAALSTNGKPSAETVRRVMEEKFSIKL